MMGLRFRQGDENHPPEFAVTNCLLTDGYQPVLAPSFVLVILSIAQGVFMCTNIA